MESSIKDNIDNVNNCIRKINPFLNSWNNYAQAEKKNVQSTIDNNFKSLDIFLRTIKSEIDSLVDENLEKRYKDEYAKLKEEVRKLQDDWARKKNEMMGLNHQDITIELRNKPIDQLNVQEAMDRGDKQVKESGMVINNIKGMVKDSNNQADKIIVELNKQNEQLGNIQGELSEIDESLKRSNKTMRQILVGLATDKFILCMIVVIVLIIIAILIVSFTGGDKNNNFNVPHDLFQSSTTVTTTTTTPAATTTTAKTI